MIWWANHNLALAGRYYNHMIIRCTILERHFLQICHDQVVPAWIICPVASCLPPRKELPILKILSELPLDLIAPPPPLTTLVGIGLVTSPESSSFSWESNFLSPKSSHFLSHLVPYMTFEVHLMSPLAVGFLTFFFHLNFVIFWPQIGQIGQHRAT